MNNGQSTVLFEPALYVKVKVLFMTKFEAVVTLWLSIDNCLVRIANMPYFISVDVQTFKRLIISMKTMEYILIAINVLFLTSDDES